MGRLDKERQAYLEPIRMKKAYEAISNLGYKVEVISETEIQFNHPNDFSGKTVKYFPYSGWATGSNIKDGRGLKKLLKQLNK